LGDVEDIAHQIMDLDRGVLEFELSDGHSCDIDKILGQSNEVRELTAHLLLHRPPRAWIGIRALEHL
jgi:hypothetical protein